MRIADYLEPPESTDLDAFIARLDDDDDRVRRHLRQFVVPEGVHRQLDDMLGEVGRRLTGGKDIGRFIYGSFGSGKSHLLTVLGKMLEDDPEVYEVGQPALTALRGSHPWLSEQKVLVVRLNMMGKRGLTTALFEAFNAALPEGAPRVSFTNEERVFQDIEADAERMGGLDALLRQASEEGYLRFPADQARTFYDTFRRGDLDKRLSLAADLQKWRNHGRDAIRPQDLWLDAREGFERLAAHAQQLGYTAIAWLVDELVIWIREKDRSTYIKQVNDLSSLVDHDAHRALPFFVAVAVQMDIAETCPEDISEKDFREQLGFISNRFQPALHLEDQDLYVVASQRVLALRPELDDAGRQAYADAVDAFFRRHADPIRALSGELDPEQVRSLYPFHPALLRVLVDVTHALSRNRTAVAALYGLLDAYPELTVGELVPLGALWDILFTPDNVQALRNNAKSALAQQLADSEETWRRLEGKVSAVATDASAEPRELSTLVRSALLCQLSRRQYFPDGRALSEAVTASLLLRLNQTDVRAVTERTGLSKVVRLFRRLNGVAPQVQVLTDGSDPVLHVKTESVDIEKVLARARGEVGFSDRLSYVRQLLVDQLGLTAIKRGLEGDLKVTWRGTFRTGKLRVVNVRTLSYAGRENEFDAGSAEFLVLVDYPFDEEPGRTRQDDVETLLRARGRSTHWTLAWLPEHFSAAERQALDNAAACQLVRRNERRLLEDFSANDAREVKRALEAFEAGRRAELEDAVRRLYFDEGQVYALKEKLDGLSLEGVDRGRAVEGLAHHVLDARYPNHPGFKRRVGVAELSEVGEAVFRAANTGQQVDLNGRQMALVEAVARPLELVFPGSSNITARSDGRYLRSVTEWVGVRDRFEARELRARLMAEDGWQFGLSREVADFFLLYLLQVAGYEAQVGTRSATVQGLREVPDRFVLVKDEVVDSPTWDKALRAAEQLLGVRGRADLPTSPEQSKLVRDAVEAARSLRRDLVPFGAELAEVCGWTGVPTCPRRAAAEGLVALLDRLSGASGNAPRVRVLAQAVEDPAFYGWSLTRAHLGEERATLRGIRGGKTAFETVAEHGTAEEQAGVCDKLRGWLAQPVKEKHLLSRCSVGWPEQADKVLQAILKRIVKPPPPKPPPAGRKEAKSTGSGDALRTQARQSLEALLAEFPAAAKLRVHISVEPAE